MIPLKTALKRENEIIVPRERNGSSACYRKLMRFDEVFVVDGDFSLKWLYRGFLYSPIMSAAIFSSVQSG